MILKSSELAAALEEEEVNPYVLIAKYSKLYARQNDLEDIIVPHITHVAFLMYNVGVIRGRSDAKKKKTNG